MTKANPLFGTASVRHVVRATFVAGNGRRVEEDFPITKQQAEDPLARAAVISGISARSTKRLANWVIVTITA